MAGWYPRPFTLFREDGARQGENREKVRDRGSRGVKAAIESHQHLLQRTSRRGPRGDHVRECP